LRATLSLLLRSAGYLALVVERAKKCLDFTGTLYFVHLLFCCAYRGTRTHHARIRSLACIVIIFRACAHACTFRRLAAQLFVVGGQRGGAGGHGGAGVRCVVSR
jgi:hypothetical protein